MSKLVAVLSDLGADNPSTDIIAVPEEMDIRVEFEKWKSGTKSRGFAEWLLGQGGRVATESEIMIIKEPR